MKRRFEPNRRAMTLLEVMLALAILLVLSVGVFAFFFRMSSQRDQLVRLASQQRDAAMLLDRIESALLSAVAVTADGSAGVEGDETSLTVAARGVQPGLEETAALADAAVVTFSFDESSAVCTQSVSASEGSLSEPLLPLVERMRFRYSDGRRWSASFDSLQSGGLPVAVEVSIWFEPRVPRTQTTQGPVFPGAESGDELLGISDDSELGPLDLPPPEPEEPEWIPREPDHVRVISIPDAPDWKERAS